MSHIIHGYVKVKCYGHPRSDKNGEVFEHVLIAEKALGRYLFLPHQIHHFDEVKSNNRNDNLVICEDTAYHRLLHVRQRIKKLGGDPDKHGFCGQCKSVKLRGDFYVSKTRLNGIYTRCKDCSERAVEATLIAHGSSIQEHNDRYRALYREQQAPAKIAVNPRWPLPTRICDCGTCSICKMRGYVKRSRDRIKAGATPRPRTRDITAFGKTLNVFHWAKATGLSRGCISRRLASGMSPEAALSTPSSRPSSRGLKDCSLTIATYQAATPVIEV